ncbi:MAG: hypothetical protein V3V53_00690 [Bacteroidales bacterium]
MHHIFRIIAIILLLFNAISALFGGWGLISDPSGETLKMPLLFLEHSPFDNFLVPGIILFITNGLFSLLFAVMALLKFMNYSWLVIFQGVILVGWLIIQIIMIRDFYGPLHVLYFSVGLLLIATGWILARQDQAIYQSH